MGQELISKVEKLQQEAKRRENELCGVQILGEREMMRRLEIEKCAEQNMKVIEKEVERNSSYEAALETAAKKLNETQV
jgi:DNA repair protein RadC